MHTSIATLFYFKAGFTLAVSLLRVNVTHTALTRQKSNLIPRECMLFLSFYRDRIFTIYEVLLNNKFKALFDFLTNFHINLNQEKKPFIALVKSKCCCLTSFDSFLSASVSFRMLRAIKLMNFIDPNDCW